MSNRVRDWYRKEAKHRGISLDTRLPGGNSVNVGDFLVAPNSNLRINVSSLEKITKGMPLRGQLAIYFRYYLGWSPSRTARITEETPAAVSSTLTRAHEWIKERHDRQFLLDTLLDH
jgi:DNA-directed RNA polymerase specialized sigma24 family protein